jgi:hypothetical protein
MAGPCHVDHQNGLRLPGVKRAVDCRDWSLYEKNLVLGSHILQETSVSVEDSVGFITISTVYLPPKYSLKREQLEDFYNNLGSWFIAGGDYNAKHTDWGSRLITLRGREVLKTMERNNLKQE